MTRMSWPIALAGALAVGMLASCRTSKLEPGTGACLADQAAVGTRVLVFSRTAGYRHESIPAAVDAIRTIGVGHGFTVENTEDASTFTSANLGRFAAVVFLSTTGDILDASQQAAFGGYIRNGGGFVGIHSATDTEYDWPWYGQLVGAYFQSHPAIQPATVKIQDPAHLSTRCVPAAWARTDEWYDFRAQPTAGVSILATLDESTYQGGGMGANHPIAWYHRFDGGRAWYTAMGHTTESYADSTFRDHLAGGILWAVARQ
jgi:type 1 glutamine amidotransferase